MSGLLKSVAASLLLAGCAPTLPSLLANKHYREAVCAGADDDAADEVAAAIARDADAQLHIHTLTREELEPVLGRHAPSIDARNEFVRVRVLTNTVPVDGYQLQLEVNEAEGLSQAAPANWASLIRATKETMPSNRLYATYVTPDNLLKTTAAIFSLGTSLLFTNSFQPGLAEGAPSPEDFERSAPIASRLQRALGPTGCDNPGGPAQPGGDCTLFFVLPRNQSARWKLAVKQTFVARRLGDERELDCSVSRSDTVELRAPFSSKTRPLKELVEATKSR
jgi:hypothetical protein